MKDELVDWLRSTGAPDEIADRYIRFKAHYTVFKDFYDKNSTITGVVALVEALPTHNGLEVQQEPLPKSTNRNQE